MRGTLARRKTAATILFLGLAACLSIGRVRAQDVVQVKDLPVAQAEGVVEGSPVSQDKVEAAELPPLEAAESAVAGPGMPASATLAAEEPEVTGGKKWAVLIGADSYRDPLIAVRRYAVNDVRVLRFVLTAAPNGFSEECVEVLPAELATRAQIVIALRRLVQETSPDDLVFFHYSGNATLTRAGELVLFTYDGSIEDPATTAMPFSLVAQALGAMRARHFFISLDTSHAAAAATCLGALAAQGKNCTLVTPCKVGQLAYDSDASEHGRLTHSLLTALAGNGDRSGSGFVSCREAACYAVEALAESLGASGETATPCAMGGSGAHVLVGVGQDRHATDIAVLTRQAKEEEAARRKAAAEDETRRNAEAEETARKRAEEEESAQKKAKEEEEAARKKAEAEEAARGRAEQEEAARKTLEEQKAAQDKREVEEAARREQEEELAAQRKAAGPGRKWALVIGISRYQDGRLPQAPAASNDAKAVDELLRGFLHFDADKVAVLREEAATHDAITGALRALRQNTKMNDTVFLYFSGLSSAQLPEEAGAPGENSFALCPFDTGVAPFPHDLLPFDELDAQLALMAAAHVVVVLDTARAAEAGARMKRLEQVGKDVILLAGHGLTGNAGEGAGISMFTQHLVEGLRGAADTTVDGLVTMNEALAYCVQRAVASNSPQHPQAFGSGQDLVLWGTASDIDAVGPVEKWAVVVGLNRYQSEQLPELSGAVNDAKQIQALLVDSLGFDKDAVMVFNDSLATRARIIHALRRLERIADPKDLVWFYFSGHSLRMPNHQENVGEEQELVLCPYDAELYKGGIGLPVHELVDLLTACPAAKVVVALETSRAGLAGPYFTKLLEKGRNAVLLAACGPEESTMDAALTSPTGETSKQGAFTYYLVRGLKEEADTSGNGRIDAKELTGYVVEKLKSAGYDQVPQLVGEAKDLVLTNVSKKK